MIYKKTIPAVDPDDIQKLFEENGWKNGWQDGIYNYHHYHSTAHEVLGVARGGGRIQFGGENGIVISVEAGDVIVIPAGVAHKCLESAGDFQVVGAYPDGTDYNILKGNPAKDQELTKTLQKCQCHQLTQCLERRACFTETGNNKYAWIFNKLNPNGE